VLIKVSATLSHALLQPSGARSNSGRRLPKLAFSGVEFGEIFASVLNSGFSVFSLELGNLQSLGKHWWLL
jgi:hypothetical protein